MTGLSFVSIISYAFEIKKIKSRNVIWPNELFLYIQTTEYKIKWKFSARPRPKYKEAQASILTLHIDY